VRRRVASRLIEPLDDVGRRPDLGIPSPQVDERLAAAYRSFGHPREQRCEVLLRKPLEPVGPWTHRHKVVTDTRSMATSSGDDVPRNLEFLFSRNRLNVAISRARCLAVLVASPRLLEIRCRTVEQMRLVSALCRLVELAP
jgi:hypothetical protein